MIGSGLQRRLIATGVIASLVHLEQSPSFNAPEGDTGT
jgi:hypothetical protein